MPPEDDSREQGVEFGPLADDLNAQEYPMSKAEVLDAFGDREIEFEDGRETLREIIEPLGVEEFESAEGLKRSVIGMAGDEAIGREDYSDRGGQASDGEGADESV